jgi:hypothetical protein
LLCLIANAGSELTEFDSFLSPNTCELAKFKSMSLNKSELNTVVVVFLIKREFKKG